MQMFVDVDMTDVDGCSFFTVWYSVSVLMHACVTEGSVHKHLCMLYSVCLCKLANVCTEILACIQSKASVLVCMCLCTFLLHLCGLKTKPQRCECNRTV